MVFIEKSFSDVLCTQRYATSQKKQLDTAGFQPNNLPRKHLNNQSFGKPNNQTTIIFFKVNGGTFILRKITHDLTTESLDVNIEAVETGIQTIFKCFKESEQYSFVEDLYKKPPPAETKSRKRII